MQYTYVGVDSHKDTHAAVFLDCFFEKLGEVYFENKPSKFGDFLKKADKFKAEGTTLLFGLEDVSDYGRSLMVFLKNKNQSVKHVNSLLVANERKNQDIAHKTDSFDAECAARVLLTKLNDLPDADPQDKYWILRTAVMRRNFIVNNNASLKNHLHTLLTPHYPNYRSFFYNIEGNSSLAFFMRYPSPSTLKGITTEELADFFYEPSQGKVGFERAKLIMESIEDTTVPFQEIRDEAVRSTIRQLQFNMGEIEHLDASLAKLLDMFGCTLTSMAGLDTVTASQMLSCIGDIKKFPTPAKLAKYAGVAPITYASGKRDMKFANQRGNRELNHLFFDLAVRVSMTFGSSRKVINPFFYDYYHQKQSEGKTKRQALKCVERRLVNIIWGMLTYNQEYINPPTYNAPKEKTKE